MGDWDVSMLLNSLVGILITQYYGYEVEYVPVINAMDAVHMFAKQELDIDAVVWIDADYGVFKSKWLQALDNRHVVSAGEVGFVGQHGIFLRPDASNLEKLAKYGRFYTTYDRRALPYIAPSNQSRVAPLPSYAAPVTVWDDMCEKGNSPYGTNRSSAYEWLDPDFSAPHVLLRNHYLKYGCPAILTESGVAESTFKRLQQMLINASLYANLVVANLSDFELADQIFDDTSTPVAFLSWEPSYANALLGRTITRLSFNGAGLCVTSPFTNFNAGSNPTCDFWTTMPETHMSPEGLKAYSDADVVIVGLAGWYYQDGDLPQLVAV